MRKIVVTGGYGFIGGNLVNYWGKKYPNDEIIVLDKCGYAANPDFITVTHKSIRLDICFEAEIRDLINTIKPYGVIHLAAESHVCRSIEGPREFFETNVIGTMNVIHAFKELNNGGRFLYMSTDEIFGEVENGRRFNEESIIRPRSPYAASKAGGDHVVNSYAHTFGMDVVIANAGNNFGPNQHVEKLIPKTIKAILEEKPITVYGDGSQIRDWVNVEDTCRAIDLIFHQGPKGNRYCISGNNPMSNLELIRSICFMMDGIKKFTYTNGRPTDDKWYESNSWKIEQLGFKPKKPFIVGLTETIEWYRAKYFDTKSSEGHTEPSHP